jgi:hypothetical protein
MTNLIIISPIAIGSFALCCRRIATFLILTLAACSILAATTRRVEDVIIAPDGTTFVGKLRITPCSSAAVKTCVADRSFFVPIVTGYFDADLSAEHPTRFFHVQYLSPNQRIQWEEQWTLPAKSRSPWQVEELRVNGEPRNDDRVDLRTADRSVSVSCNGDGRYVTFGPESAGPWVLRPDTSRASRPECIALQIAAPQSLGTSAPVYLPSTVKPPSTKPVGVRALMGATRSTQLTEGDVAGLIPDLQVRAVTAPGFTNSRAAIINDTGGIEGAVGNPGDCVRVDGTSDPCGGPVTRFIDHETPSGIVDGANVVFSIQGVPAPSTSLDLYRNGLFQSIGVDYNLSATTIVFVTPATPQVGDILVAKYRQ